MLTKHTPGPWSITQTLIGETAVTGTRNENRRHVCTLPMLAIHSCSSDEYHANARLIAAAPELLEACQEMVKHLEETDFDVCGTPEKFMNKWKAAIEKATGEKEQAV